MLKVTQKTDRALVLMRHLALLWKPEPSMAALSLADVARSEGISQGYLEEIARLLRASKLVTGRRGAGGGYVLARDPRDLTVADVVTAIEGATWTTECLGETNRPVRNAANAALWRKVQGQVMTALRGISIADLLVPAAAPASPTAASSAAAH